MSVDARFRQLLREVAELRLQVRRQQLVIEHLKPKAIWLEHIEAACGEEVVKSPEMMARAIQDADDARRDLVNDIDGLLQSGLGRGEPYTDPIDPQNLSYRQLTEVFAYLSGERGTRQ